MAERLVRGWTSLGMSQKDAAARLGVDPSTLAKWEKGEAEPAGAALGAAGAVRRAIAVTRSHSLTSVMP